MLGSVSPIELGFEDSEVELLRLCDADWEKKYQLGWLDRYFESHPAFSVQLSERRGCAPPRPHRCSNSHEGLGGTAPGRAALRHGADEGGTKARG